ncbi:MAG TPA: PqiC family protein [Thermoanaerobaculia bacterium]|nr:PqiC family protein [Thermoanaerobaculia bacterium]
MTIRRAFATMLLLSAAGCSLFSRSKSEFYALEQIAPAGPPAVVRGVPIAIDALELPPGFDRRELVVRLADHKLDIRRSQQWSASLEKMVLHTLAFNVARRLPAGMIVLPGQAQPTSPTRSIDVVVEEIAAGPERVAVLDARWRMQQSGKETISRHERITIELSSLDSAQIADGFSRALAELADRMVAQLSAS